MKGRDGIARVVYIAASDRRVIMLHAFMKKTRKTSRRAIETARRRLQEFDR